MADDTNTSSSVASTSTPSAQISRERGRVNFDKSYKKGTVYVIPDIVKSKETKLFEKVAELGVKVLDRGQERKSGGNLPGERAEVDVTRILYNHMKEKINPEDSPAFIFHSLKLKNEKDVVIFHERIGVAVVEVKNDADVDPKLNLATATPHDKNKLKNLKKALDTGEKQLTEARDFLKQELQGNPRQLKEEPRLMVTFTSLRDRKPEDVRQLSQSLRDRPDIDILCGKEEGKYGEWLDKLFRPRGAEVWCGQPESKQAYVNTVRGFLSGRMYSHINTVSTIAMSHHDILFTPEQAQLLHSDDHLLHCWGPPGTGKTLMLIQRAKRWLNDGKKVMICVADRSHYALLQDLIKATMTENEANFSGRISYCHDCCQFDQTLEKLKSQAPPGGEPAPPGGEPAPPGGAPAPPGGEPAPPGGEPAPPGGEPAPPGGEPAPPGGEPAPPGGEPAPPGGEPAPPGGEPAPPGGAPAPPGICVIADEVDKGLLAVALTGLDIKRFSCLWTASVKDIQGAQLLERFSNLGGRRHLLTETFRCPEHVVKVARKLQESINIAPLIEAYPNMPFKAITTSVEAKLHPSHPSYKPLDENATAFDCEDCSKWLKSSLSLLKEGRLLEDEQWKDWIILSTEPESISMAPALVEWLQDQGIPATWEMPTNADAQNADAQNADAQNADAQNADAQNADAQNADAQNAATQNADAQNADAQHADAQHADAQHADAQHAATQHADAQHADAQHADAQHADAQHADAQNAATQHADAQHADAQHADAQNADAQNADAQHADAQHADAQHAATQNADAQNKVAAWKERIVLGLDKKGKPAVHLVPYNYFSGLEKPCVLVIHWDCRDDEPLNESLTDRRKHQSFHLFQAVTRSQAELAVLFLSPSPAADCFSLPPEEERWCLEKNKRRQLEDAARRLEKAGQWMRDHDELTERIQKLEEKVRRLEENLPLDGVRRLENVEQQMQNHDRRHDELTRTVQSLQQRMDEEIQRRAEEQKRRRWCMIL